MRDAMNKRAGGAVEDIATALLDGERILAADIGAAGDLPAPWFALEGNGRFLCVEPDAAACERLKTRHAARGRSADYDVHAVALSGTGGDRTLYRTASPTGSSLFDPDIPLVRAYTTSEYLQPVETETVRTLAGGAFLADAGWEDLDLMKLDVQGCELEILESLSKRTLDRMALVELEASPHDRGPGYPTYCDLHNFLSGHGFRPLDVWPDRQPRSIDGSRETISERLGVYPYAPSVSRRVWEMDVLYYRPPDAPELEARDLRVRLALLCTYGFFGEALAGTHDAYQRQLVDAEQRAALDVLIVAWHAVARRRPWYSSRWPWPTIRKLVRVLQPLVPHTGADYIHDIRL